MKNSLKKTLTAALSAALICQGAAAMAADKDVSIVLTIDDTNVTVNGETITVTAPFIADDTTLVPLRVIAEGLGAKVDWEGETKTVTVTDSDKTIVLAIGSTSVTVNGEEKSLLTAPQLKNDTTMLPIRFISEEMGANVDWNGETRTVTVTNSASNALARIDGAKWQYNEDDGVYWQVGIPYCANPASEKYETLGVFVPESYMTASDNGDGTYTCKINTGGAVNGYTAASAPIVIPVDTPGYSAMSAPSAYVSDAAQYTGAGFIYVKAGCRGRDDGAPAGVTDLKAAIRYIRYNNGIIPGDSDSIFSFGMSGGGAQSALVGATGNSDMYTPYLNAIGAVSGVSDAVKGSMCWCPITNLDIANEAYEWNMGVTRSGLDKDMQALSDGLAAAFADYINEIRLTSENGTVLLLEQGDDGSYTKGSYYDYIKSVIEQSLNNFLSDTEFPYTKQASGGFGGRGGGMPSFADGEKPDFANGEAPGETKNDTENLPIEAVDGITRTNQTEQQTEAVTYNTAEDYIESLNGSTAWIVYDKNANTATISSVEDFVKACKNASKDVGAFDALDASQGENTLFGYGDGKGAHFDPIMAKLLENSEYAEAYNTDIARTDALGKSVEYRLNMYTPMYFIDDMYDGYKTADTAKYWRIRTGINQGDTALATEVNLALALKAFGADVDFETVWGMAHVEAERTGSSNDNFIAWVNDCMSK